MRKIITGLTLFVALGLLAPIGDAAAPKPPSYTTAAVEFLDGPYDGIVSDGRGPYVNGTPSGLEVRMWTCAACSQDLTIGTFRSGRAIQFTYSPATDVTQPTGTNPPTGVLLDNAFVNIRDIALLAPGQTKLTRASFNTDIGYFRWLGAPPPEHGGGSLTGSAYGSQAVVVTRSLEDPSVWTVSTPVPSVTSGSYTAGDLSVLLRDSRLSR
ncbi:MAG: hypothetical protein ACT4QD_24665 [Acidobacteriota bacterium]